MIKSIITAMKKFMVVFILLCALVAGVAVWYSPFSFRGAAEYENNAPYKSIDALTYGRAARYDKDGSLDDMYGELSSLRAKVVKVTETGGATVVYAISDRVKERYALSSGEEYNVMAAYRDGHIAIGAPVLQGSY